jgi:hypothetical protein
MAEAKPPDIRPLYAVPIHQCIESGDIDEMRKLAGEAEAHVAEVSEALEKLKAAIGSYDAR